MSLKSVLIVSPTYSHPANQGNSARIQRFGKELIDRGLEVDFFYYGMDGITDAQREDMTAFWNRFYFMRAERLPHPKWPHCWGIDDWCPDALCRAIEDLVAQSRYDAVIVNYVWLSKVLRNLKNCVKVVDAHDLFGDRKDALLAQGLEPRWYFTSPEEEALGFGRADVAIAIQDKEAEALERYNNTTVLVVGHCEHAKFLHKEYDLAGSTMFGYLGSGNPLNARSVIALDEALQDTNLPWLLAGTIAKRDLVFSSNPTIVGPVQDVSAFYKQVECVLNPMVGGTGLKIKTIEALAYGKAIIGTNDAFEGLLPQDPFHKLHTPADVVEGMRSYARSATVRDRLKRSSRALYFHYMARVDRQYNDLIALTNRLSTKYAV